MSARAKQLVGTDEIRAYQEDGAVLLRRVFTASEIALCRAGIEANIANPSPRALIASQPDDPGFFFEDFCNWAEIPAYRDFIFNSPAAAIAGLLTGSTTIRLYHDHLLVKEPNTRQKTPWHQDQPYYNIDGRQNCSIWIPMDPVPRESTLEFLRGSHLGPWLMPRTFLSGEARWFPPGTLAELPDIEANRAQFDTLGWALEPGDAVFFHMATLHAASGTGGTRRRVLSLRFIGDDIIHAPRPWKTSPDFPGLAEELPAHAKMDHRLFPVVWQDH